MADVNERRILKVNLYLLNSSVGTKKCARKRIYHQCELQIDKSVPRVTVWHHKVGDAKTWHHKVGDAKTVTLGTDLSIRTSHSCQILILYYIRSLA